MSHRLVAAVSRWRVGVLVADVHLVAADAEGATKVVRVRVTGAEDDGQAAVAARKVAESQLVKCSWYGNDPYWGRVVSELGSAGVAFDSVFKHS